MFNINYLLWAKTYGVFLAAMILAKIGDMPKQLTEPYGVDLILGVVVFMAIPCYMFYMAGKQQALQEGES